MRDPWKILINPHLSEKAIGLVESKNELVFFVQLKASKKAIRWAVKKALDVEVESVRTLIDSEGRKKAFIKLPPSEDAMDVATRLGMM